MLRPRLRWVNDARVWHHVVGEAHPTGERILVADGRGGRIAFNVQTASAVGNLAGG